MNGNVTGMKEWTSSGGLRSLHENVVAFNGLNASWKIGRHDFQVTPSQFCLPHPRIVAWSFVLLIQKMVFRSGRIGFGVEFCLTGVKSMVFLYNVQLSSRHYE
jgi:hypothetical protein